jgi:hypothetical protein
VSDEKKDAPEEIREEEVRAGDRLDDGAVEESEALPREDEGESAA